MKSMPPRPIQSHLDRSLSVGSADEAPDSSAGVPVNRPNSPIDDDSRVATVQRVNEADQNTDARQGGAPVVQPMRAALANHEITIGRVERDACVARADDSVGSEASPTPLALFISMSDRLDETIEVLKQQPNVLADAALNERVQSDLTEYEWACKTLGEHNDFTKILTYKAICLTGFHAKLLAIGALTEGDTEALTHLHKVLYDNSEQLSQQGDVVRALPSSINRCGDFSPNAPMLDMRRMALKIEQRLPYIKSLVRQFEQFKANAAIGALLTKREFLSRQLAQQERVQTLERRLPHLINESAFVLEQQLDNAENLVFQIRHALISSPYMPVPTVETAEENQCRQAYLQSVYSDLSRISSQLRSVFVEKRVAEISDYLDHIKNNMGTMPRGQLLEALNWLVHFKLSMDKLADQAALLKNNLAVLRQHARLVKAYQDTQLAYYQYFKSGIEGGTITLLGLCHLPDAEKSNLVELTRELPRWSPDEPLDLNEGLRRLVNLDKNLVLLFGALGRHTQTVQTSLHLSVEAKLDIQVWLARLASNRQALMVDSEETVKSFVGVLDDLFAQLLAAQATATRLANQVHNASRNAACTDWASTVLIDMMAVAESYQLEHDLAKLAIDKTDESEMVRSLGDFVDSHQLQFMKLLRFSAFRTYMQTSAALSESVEMGLYVYRALQQKVVLPGQGLGGRMQYGAFAAEQFGANDLEKHVYSASQAMADDKILGETERLLLLDNLGLFDVLIWELLKSELPQRQYDGYSVSACDEKIQKIVQESNKLDYGNANDAAACAHLDSEYRTWSNRREVAIENSGPDQKILQKIAERIKPSEHSNSDVK